MVTLQLRAPVSYAVRHVANVPPFVVRETTGITRTGCRLVLNEVYGGEIKDFLQRGDVFFSLMPSPDTEKELSEHSPLYDAGSHDEADDEDTK
jgi:hypothetical protein